METVSTPVAYPNLKQSWGLLGITVLVAIAVNVVLFIIMAILVAVRGQETGTAFASNSLTFLLSYIVIFGAVCLIAIRLKKKREGGFAPSFTMPSTLNVLMIVLATLGIYFVVEPIVDFIPMPDFIKELFLALLGEQDI